MPYYEHPRAAITADVAMFCGDPGDLHVLLVRRGRDPFKGEWALPGGFVDEGERVEDAARRELAEETGIAWTGPLTQVGAYADPGRDPRGWTAAIVWAAYAGPEPLAAAGGDDADEAAWLPIDSAKGLAFDHDEIVHAALATIRTDIGSV